ncbi:hypothetical protein [Paracoccus sp. SY]|uniref:hypothetical protein n=1 Tax=Paracoccus sp. SY TaxID=1330255 RepID=UPI000CD043F3|nr:hypothetical protein [Paracoccus sp. SY]
MAILEKFRKAKASASQALTAARSSLADIRSQIASKQTELEGLDQRPVAFAEAVAALDTKLREQCEIGEYALKRMAHDLSGRIDGYSVFRTTHIEGREIALQTLLAGSAFRDALIAQLEAVYGNDPGLTSEERAAERERIEGELDDLEAMEEMLIREGAKAGIPIARRKDAHPGALLAPDSALPA